MACAAPSLAAGADGSEFLGEWQLRLFTPAQSNYDCYPYSYSFEATLSIREDGTAELTEVTSDHTAVFRGAWTSKRKNEITIAFEDSDTVSFRLNGGVMKSYGGRGTMTFTQHDTQGELTIGLPIDEYHFPDPKFRAYLKDCFGYIQDWIPYLSQKEIKTLKELDCRNTDIDSLAGVRYLTELTTLICPGKNLEALDLSGLKKLKELECQNNRLASLNLSGCASLVSIDCSGNQLTELDLSGLTKLKTLNCGNNLLEALNTSEARSLELLWVVKNRLSALNVENNTKLKKLDAHGNSSLAEARFGKNSSLDWLNLNGTAVRELDLTGCGKLRQLAVKLPGANLYQLARKTRSGTATLYTENEVTVRFSDKITVSPVPAAEKPAILFHGLDWGISLAEFSSLYKISKGWERGGFGTGKPIGKTIYGAEQITPPDSIVVFNLHNEAGTAIEKYGYRANRTSASFFAPRPEGGEAGNLENARLYEAEYTITLKKDTTQTANELIWKLTSLYGQPDVYRENAVESLTAEGKTVLEGGPDTYTVWYGGENTVLCLVTYDGEYEHWIDLRYATLEANRWMLEAAAAEP